ncbi:uncharacterized protein LOC135342475 [Halichondria panicea]|uniref:uncharacterized protein LOC135342475 n=1 Tax=Halichondria panicea TaxID=6063 RepID=UPI00312BAB5B
MPSNGGLLRFFYSLQELAETELTGKRVTVEDFRRSLACLSISIKAELENFLKGKYATFKKAESIEDIFFHLNFYLSFIDFSLLEHIIDHFGSSDLKQKMSQHSLDMVQFRKTTTVAEIFPHLSDRPEPPPEYVKLEMEFDYDPHTFTLEDLEQTRLKLGREFSLSKYQISGSVVLVCILPEGMVRADMQEQNNSFLDLKLVRLDLNNKCLYHIDLSRKFAHNINNAILSTPDSRGLAIIISLSPPIPSRLISDRCNDNIRRLNNRFKEYNFAMYIRQGRLGKLELNGIMYAARHYVHIPDSSKYPILFMVSGAVQGDVNTFVTGHDKIDIGKDIIEPLVSSKHLADNPKI